MPVAIIVKTIKKEAENNNKSGILNIQSTRVTTTMTQN